MMDWTLCRHDRALVVVCSGELSYSKMSSSSMKSKERRRRFR